MSDAELEILKKIIKLEILKKIIENKLDYEWAECKALYSEYPEYPRPNLKDYVFKPIAEQVETCEGLVVLGLVKRWEDGFVMCF